MINYPANAATPLKIETTVADENNNPIPNSVGTVNKATLADPSFGTTSVDTVTGRTYAMVQPSGKIGPTTITIERWNASGQGPNPVVGSDTINFTGPVPHHLILTPVLP